MSMISGFWFPELLGDNTEPQCTFTKKFGGYRKMGQLVYFNIDLVVDQPVLGATGPMHTTLPPYAPVLMNFVFEVHVSGIPLPAGSIKVGAWLEGSEGLYVFFLTDHWNGVRDGIDCGVLVPGANIIVSGGYIAQLEV